MKLTAYLFLAASLVFFLSSEIRAQEKKKENKVVKAILMGPAALIDKFKKPKPAERLTLANIGEQPYIGIGEIQDSATGMSRSFALYELLRDRPIIREGVTLAPVFIDYPFGVPYAISGQFRPSGVLLKFYENGKKVAERTFKPNDWQMIWIKVSDWMGGQPLVLGKKEKVEVDEGSAFDLPKFTPIAELLPGAEMVIKVPDYKVVPKFEYISVGVFGGKRGLENPYEHVKNVYGNYSKFKESELYFFDGTDVPYEAKKAARTIALPLYRTPRPALQYVGTEKYFTEQKDYGAAFQTCLATLSSSDDIFIGPQEQALIREKTFEKMARAQVSISSDRKYTESLFLLASKLNGTYSKDTISLSESKKYYDAIQPLKKQLTSAEQMAMKIRSTRTIGIINAAGAFTGAMASSIGGASSAASQPYINLMQTTMNNTFSTTSAMNEKLRDLFEGIDDNINSKSFLAGKELEADFGKPLVAAEVYYHLSRHPTLMKATLTEYASDKPQLNKLIKEFYVAKDPAKALVNLYNHFALIERQVLNFETRGMAVPTTISSKF
ncbi:MAG: hypothetical protein ACKO6Q_05040 [Bacteroidota bacterium]